jgi:hypothetical protein
MRSPVIFERGRAVGKCSISGAFCEMGVVEVERLVEIVDLGQVGVGEDVGEDAPLAALLGLEMARALRSQPPFQRFWFSQSLG